MSAATVGSAEASTRSQPARIARTARSPALTSWTWTAAETSSVMTTPEKPICVRSMSVTIVEEKIAGAEGSMREYVAEETMMTCAPAAMALEKTPTAASGRRFVAESTTPAEVSVLSFTRPRPGKCL